MKKLFIVGVISLFAVSCEKDWTCECYDYNGELLDTSIIKGKSKRNAKSQCTGSVNIGVVSIPGDNNCVLKK